MAQALEYLRNNEQMSQPAEMDILAPVSPEEEEQRGWVVAHFSSHELAEMDKLQGGRDIDPETGLPMYFKLAEALEQTPGMGEHLETLFAHGKAHAQGQETHLSNALLHLKNEGEHGDNQLAIIPISFAHILDQMIGGQSINPESGLRQYFLGALMALARPAISMAMRAIPSIARGAASAGRTIASGLGTAARMGGGAARTIGTAVGRGAGMAARGASAVARAAPGVLNNASNFAAQVGQHAGNLAQGLQGVGNLIQTGQQVYQQIRNPQGSQAPGPANAYGGGYSDQYGNPLPADYGQQPLQEPQQSPEEVYQQDYLQQPLSNQGQGQYGGYGTNYNPYRGYEEQVYNSPHYNNRSGGSGMNPGYGLSMFRQPSYEQPMDEYYNQPQSYNAPQSSNRGNPAGYAIPHMSSLSNGNGGQKYYTKQRSQYNYGY